MPESASMWSFMYEQREKLLDQTFQHIGLTFISLFFSVLIAVPLGILITRRKNIAGPVLGMVGILQTIPSIALLGFMIPLIGIGSTPAIVALILYALLPIVNNTYTGIRNVDREIKEAATGMGMTDLQSLLKIEIPLAMPVILAGIRTAAVINVGVATMAAYIGAGGLGEFIFGGIALNNTDMILAGSIPAALLAIFLNWMFSLLQKINIRSFYKKVWVLPLGILLLSSFYLVPFSHQGKMTAGFTPEFMGRHDGNIGLESEYKLHIRTLIINDNIMYNAVYHKNVDVISGSSTDGRVKAFDLFPLDDDKHIFPPYYAALIARKEILLEYPEIETTANLIAGLINDSIMTDLNYRVDFLKETPDSVAREFLKARGLLREPRNGHKATLVIGSKIFGDGYVLTSIYKLLMDGYTEIHTVTKTGLGGTIICFNALLNKEIDMYPEYTGTGLLVILKPSPKVLDSVGFDSRRVYDFVADEFLKRYEIQWLKPIGFNNTYALMMRREAAKSLKIRTISQLSQYNRKI